MGAHRTSMGIPIDLPPFRCCGCGAPLDAGEHASCDCPTQCASRQIKVTTGTVRHENVLKKPRCARCGSIPTLANLDGEDLCRACCTKWARSEGVAAQEADQDPHHDQ